MIKTNQLIRLEDLAKVYSSIIDNVFDIKINACVEPDTIRPSALMFATRQPYKLSNIKAESLQVALRFYVECEHEQIYNDLIQKLSMLAGLNKGKFTSNEKMFRFFSFLDFARPLSEPEVNSGKFYQTLEFMGSCLVTQCEGGVLIGNEVSTEIYFNVGLDNEFGGGLEVLSATSALVKAQESPQMANSKIGKTINTTQLASYSYTILMLKDKVCERILKALEYIEPLGVNETIKVVDTYPPFTDKELKTEKIVVLTGGQVDRNAGAFVTAQISLQDKLEIAEQEEEQEEYSSLVTIDTSYISVTNISGQHKINEDGTISCNGGTIISISFQALNRALDVDGATFVLTSSSEIVTPKTYDLTVVSSVVTVSSHSTETGGTTTI